MITKFIDFLFENESYVEQIEELLFNGDVELGKALMQSVKGEVNVMPILNKKYKELIDYLRKNNNYTKLDLFEILELQKIYLKRSKIPNDLYKLKNLVGLQFGNNIIKTIPNQIANLTSLKTLQIWENDLTEIPFEIGKLPNLTNLTIDSTNITEPPKFTKNNVLKECYIRFCKLTNFNNLCDCLNLDILSLGDNKIREIPSSVTNLKSLRSLYLKNNLITYTSDYFSKCLSLKGLYLNNNPITEVSLDICNVKSLTDLDLSGCKITSIPDEIVNLKSLSTLYLSDNPICKDVDRMQELEKMLPFANIIY